MGTSSGRHIVLPGIQQARYQYAQTFHEARYDASYSLLDVRIYTFNHNSSNYLINEKHELIECAIVICVRKALFVIRNDVSQVEQ